MRVSLGIPARLSAYYFAFFSHAGAFVSYFALYLAAHGLSAAEIAFALSMPQLARVVAPALWAWLADGWGARYAGARRAIVIFSGFALLGGIASLYAMQRAGSIALALLVMSLLSAGAMPLMEAITFSLLEGRAGQYGPIRLWGSIGFILAVLGTGVWLDHHDAQTLLDVVLVLTAAACAASFLLPRGGAPHAQHETARLGSVLRRPEVLAFFGACTCMTAAHGAMYVF
jgi:PPP family 3-phenylpropionic acid transporter